MSRSLFVLILVLASIALVGCAQRPEVNPVGSWQGSLIATKGSSGTRVFTADIRESASAATYTGEFTVGNEVYHVTGGYKRYFNGEIFVFSAPLSELQPQDSPVTPLGFTWSGEMTREFYAGNWYIFRNLEGDAPSEEGEFYLERQP